MIPAVRQKRKYFGNVTTVALKTKLWGRSLNNSFLISLYQVRDWPKSEELGGWESERDTDHNYKHTVQRASGQSSGR